MKIGKVCIQNFRSIWELELPPEPEQEFGNLVVLIGRNNSGKSNIINALRLALTQLDGKLVKELPFQPHTWFFGYDGEPAKIEITIRLDKEEVEKIKDEIKTESGIEDVKGIKLTVEVSKENKKIVWKLSEMKLLGHVSPKTMEITNETIKVAKQIAGSKTPTKKESSSSGVDVVKNGDIVYPKILEALVGIMSYASGKIRYIYPAQAVQPAQRWDGASEPAIPPDLQENIKQLLSMYERHRFRDYLGGVKAESNYIGGETEPTKYHHGESLPLWLFGSGDQSFDGIVAAIQLQTKRQKEGILFLETPEMNLHPEYVRELAVFIEETAERENIQIFVVTQSPEFIDALLDRSNIILVRQDIRNTPLGFKPATKCISLKAKDIWLIESVIAELGSARILFANVVFLVEGGDDASLLRYWINSNRQRLRHLRKYSTHMLPYSRIGIKGAIRTCKSLGVRFFAFLDGDKQGKEDYKVLVKEKVARHGFQWTVADVLGFIDGEKLVQAINNVMGRLGIKEDELESRLKKTNAYENYQGYIRKVKDGLLDKEEGKEAFKNIINIAFQNFKEIQEKFHEKRWFSDRFKRMLGSELMRFRLETPEEIIGFLARIDEMLRPK